MNDIEICKRIVGLDSCGVGDPTVYTPMGDDDAIVFRLMVKHGVIMHPKTNSDPAMAYITGSLVSTLSHDDCPRRAICLAIIAGHR